MPSGFFLGGVAEGMADNAKRALESDRLAQEGALRTRALDLTEFGQKANIGINERAQTLAERNSARDDLRQGQALADKRIAETMAVVGETVKSGVAAGRDPETIKRAIAPLVESAARIAARVGRDPVALTAQVDAMLTGPTAVEAATVRGTAEGTAQLAQQAVTAPTAISDAELKGRAAGIAEAAKQKAIAAAGIVDENAGFKSKDEKVKAENSLRDDFLKQAQPFITVRDAKNRLDNLQKTGAGDMSLIFQFMKMLDPTSTVREGEYATAANSGGTPSWLQGYYNKAIGEGVVGTKVRREILEQANKFYEAAAVQHDRNATTFANIAKRLRLDPDNVVINLAPTGKVVQGVTPGGLKFSVIPPPPPGFVVQPSSSGDVDTARRLLGLSEDQL